MKNLLRKKGFKVNKDDTVTMMHATSPDIAEKIKNEGFIKPAFNETKAFFTQEKHKALGFGEEIIEVKVPVELVRFLPSKPSELIAEGGLRRSGNIWLPEKLPEDDVLLRLAEKRF